MLGESGLLRTLQVLNSLSAGTFMPQDLLDLALVSVHFETGLRRTLQVSYPRSAGIFMPQV
jgi:hypothetical protein